MNQVNKYVTRLIYAGWFGVMLFMLAGIPDGKYQLLDVKIGIAITDFLKSSPNIAQFIFKFNTVDESFINIIVMFLCQLFALARVADKKKHALILFCAVIWVEFWIFTVINSYLLKVICMDTSIVPEISSWITSNNFLVDGGISIISRHVFAMFFYALYFLNNEHDKFSKFLIWSCAIIFTLPSILNLKHWFSDWIFSVWFTYSIVNISKIINLEGKLMTLYNRFSKHN